MIPLPNSMLALRLGFERYYYVQETHRLAQEHYELFDRMWELCDMNGWQKFDAMIPMMGKITHTEPDEVSDFTVLSWEPRWNEWIDEHNVIWRRIE